MDRIATSHSPKLTLKDSIKDNPCLSESLCEPFTGFNAVGCLGKKALTTGGLLMMPSKKFDKLSQIYSET